MAKQNFHANIMLDLECIAVHSPDPVLIELGAVYFDLDTGRELKSLKTPISQQSCIDHGLKIDKDTLDWARQHIPETLATSETTKVTLKEALGKLSRFIQEARQDMRKSLLARRQDPGQCLSMVWGNGAVADNVWIRSAYTACGMERPWKFYEDMCVRTFVDQAGLITGRKFNRELKRTGKLHDALEDCRYQVKYLVLARNALIPSSGPASFRSKMGLTGNLPSTQTEPASKPQLNPGFGSGQPFQRYNSLKRPETSMTQTLPTLGLLQHDPRPPLPTPETSFSEKDQDAGVLLDMGNKESASTKRKRDPVQNANVQRPGMLPTPETSFSDADGAITDISSLLSKSLSEAQERIFTSTNQVMTSKGFMTPETSSSIISNENRTDPSLPGPKLLR